MNKSATLLYGCAILITVNAVAVPEVAAESSAVICIDDIDCQKKWQLAEKWVRDNSQWRIKTRTDNLIETEKQRQRNYNSLYYKVTKGSRDGKAVIELQAGCLPAVKCSPSVETAREAFTKFIEQ